MQFIFGQKQLEHKTGSRTKTIIKILIFLLRYLMNALRSGLRKFSTDFLKMECDKFRMAKSSNFLYQNKIVHFNIEIRTVGRVIFVTSESSSEKSLGYIQ